MEFVLVIGLGVSMVILMEWSYWKCKREVDRLNREGDDDDPRYWTCW